MSKFNVEPGCDVAKAWFVCLDLESRQCEVSLVLIIAGEKEGLADAAVRISSDGDDLVALQVRLFYAACLILPTSCCTLHAYPDAPHRIYPSCYRVHCYQ